MVLAVRAVKPLPCGSIRPDMMDLERIGKAGRCPARSSGLVVMGGDSSSRGCGFKSQHRRLDGQFSQ